MKMVSFTNFKREALKNPWFRREYEKLGPEFALIDSLISARIKRGLTQAALARKVGTKQSAISRLEGGNANPTLSFLRKVGTALNKSVRVTLV